MKKKIVFIIPFNSRYTSEAAGTADWIRSRINIFMRYTLRSLLKQDSQRFQAFVLYRPESEALIRAVLAQHPPLPKHVSFIPKPDYETIVAEAIRGYNLLYEVNLESDDMYHRSFVSLLERHVPTKTPVVLIPQYGYAYDSVQNRMARFFFWVPSFFATVYPAEAYRSGLRLQMPQGYRSLLTLPREFICVRQPIWINHVHSDNTGISFTRMSYWKTKGYTDAFSVPPWDNSARTAAHFGPEIEDKNTIRRILSDYI